MFRKTRTKQIINMSLGAQQPCIPFAQDVLTRIATETNAVVVAAAGNDTEDVINVTPAGCRDVITVAASGYSANGSDGELAHYSNFGNRVDVTAPGGDGQAGSRQIFSTIAADVGSGLIADYGWRAGTSMAAPHVSGVIALMKALDNTLTAHEIRSIIRGTANGAFALNCPQNRPCGMGMLDAREALLAVGNVGNPYTAEPLTLDFFRDKNTLQLTIANTSANPLLWETTLAEWWISGPVNGTVAPNSSETYTYTVSRDGMNEGDSKTALLRFRDQGSSIFATVFAYVAKQSDYSAPDGTTYVLSWYEDPDAPDGWADGVRYRESHPFSSYFVTADVGKHIVAVLLDADSSGDISVGDWYGATSDVVNVRGGQTAFAPDITVGPYTGVTEMRLPLERVQQAIDSVR